MAIEGKVFLSFYSPRKLYSSDNAQTVDKTVGKKLSLAAMLGGLVNYHNM